MLVYPAIFYKTVTGKYEVVFPDLNNGITEGDTIEEAMEMAEDFIGTFLYEDFINLNELPKPSKINDLKIHKKKSYIEEDCFKTLVSLDMLKYVNECKNTVVRKNVTIPSWLNEMCKNYNINFSKVLQEALKKEIGID